MMEYSREELIDKIKDQGFERSLREMFFCTTGPQATASDNEIMLEVLMEYVIILEHVLQKQAEITQNLEYKLCQ